MFALVPKLLLELGEEGEETGALQTERLVEQWSTGAARHFALLAASTTGEPVGVATVSEAFALYANGWYGLINEMYVEPGHRSSGVGRLLLEAVEVFGRGRGWRRLDVTAPEAERWHRTRRLYETQGFTFTGPKLKMLLNPT